MGLGRERCASEPRINYVTEPGPGQAPARKGPGRLPPVPGASGSAEPARLGSATTHLSSGCLARRLFSFTVGVLMEPQSGFLGITRQAPEMEPVQSNEEKLSGHLQPLLYHLPAQKYFIIK